VITRRWSLATRDGVRCHTKPDLMPVGCWGHRLAHRRCARSICAWRGRYRYVWESADGHKMRRRSYTEIVRASRIVATQLFDEDFTGGERFVSTEIVEKGGSRRSRRRSATRRVKPDAARQREWHRKEAGTIAGRFATGDDHAPDRKSPRSSGSITRRKGGHSTSRSSRIQDPPISRNGDAGPDRDGSVMVVNFRSRAPRTHRG